MDHRKNLTMNGINVEVNSALVEPGYRKGHRQREMARKEVARCLDWLQDQKQNLDSDQLGSNKAQVQDASSKQRSRQKIIREYGRDVDRIVRMKDADCADIVKPVEPAYESLKALSSKRSACLEVVSQISTLEDFAGNAAAEFTARAVHLSNTAENNRPNKAPSQSNETLAKQAQQCIVAVRENWRWIQQSMKCAEIHLKHAANYQEFFHEVDECEYWMNTTLGRIHLTFDRSNLQGDRADARDMIKEIKDVLLAYLKWQSRVDRLFDKSKHVVPLPARSRSLKDPRPVVTLCDYKTADFEAYDGETLTLVDNKDTLTWRVKNDRGQEGNVPSVCLLIPAPYGEAVDAGTRLRLQLLAMWTTSLKRLGYQMIAFMNLVFRDWTDEEIRSLQGIPASTKAELLSVLQEIESDLSKHWAEYPDFQELQEKILRLRMILEEASTEGKPDHEMIDSVVIQIKLLRDLLNRYKDFWSYWETYKVLVETSQQPKHILVADDWEKLKYITTAHFVKFWDADLKLDKMPKLQKLNKAESSTLTLHETPLTDLSTTEESIAVTRQEEIAETDQITKSYEEERRTFQITAVKDPRNNLELSFQRAVMMGIVDQAAGRYINPDTGDIISLAEAMNQGKITVEFTSRERIKQEKSAIGLITIKTRQETRPFTIVGVRDPDSERIITLTEAVRNEIYDDSRGVYIGENGEEMSVMDAIESGCILVEYKGEGVTTSEVVSKTYAINSVVDQRRKEKVTFAEAISMGILDRTTGAYINNLTGDRVYVGEAIKRGFIKARVINNPKTLDIDPENKIVVERIQNVKNKLLKSMNAVRAFQMAAQNGTK